MDEMNVDLQCRNVLKNPHVQKVMDEEGDLFIYGWIFDLETGEIIDQNFDFRKGTE